MADQVIDIVMATPDAIPELAQSFVASWGTFDGVDEDGLPVALVAVGDGQAMGNVTLKSDDWRPREDLSPWLGRLFVLPEHPGRGIAGRLVVALADGGAPTGHPNPVHRLPRRDGAVAGMAADRKQRAF